MPLPSTYKKCIFDERPTADITPTTFKSETKSTSDLKVGPGQVLVKVTWISLDPAMRSWLNDSKRAYTPPVKLGEVMRAVGLGVVVEVGEGSKFSVGDEVSGVVGESVTIKSSLTRANAVYPQVGESTLSLVIRPLPNSRSCLLLRIEGNLPIRPPQNHPWCSSVGLPRPSRPRRYDRLLCKLIPSIFLIPGVDLVGTFRA